MHFFKISFREIFVRMFSIFHAVFQVAVKLPNSYLGVEKQLLNYNFFWRQSLLQLFFFEKLWYYNNMIRYLNSSRVSWYSFRLKTKALGKVKKQQNFSKYKFFTLSTAGMNLLYWFHLVYSAGPKWHKSSSMYWTLPGKYPNADQKKALYLDCFHAVENLRICKF